MNFITTIVYMYLNVGHTVIFDEKLGVFRGKRI
jgi:hypothetical protein